jgi:signal transduction histidine kinase
MIGGAFIGWMLALDLERPLRQATEAITQMAAGQPLRTLPEQGPEEIRLLVRAFNTLTRQLRTLERTRTRLLANLVHELGRPLGALLSATQALAAGAVSDPDLRQELLAGMEGEIRRTHRLLDDLTHLYDKAVGPLALRRRPIPLSVWLPAALSPWREAAQEKGLAWETDIPADLPRVLIDPDRMAQAVGNIVSNAIKYTPEGGSVAGTAGTTDDAVWINVQDTGPGIAPEEQARIFMPFYRSAANSRFPQGMGLGLSIARDLVTAHGGHISLKSAPGHGSAFTLWIPITADTEPALVAPVDESDPSVNQN